MNLVGLSQSTFKITGLMAHRPFFNLTQNQTEYVSLMIAQFYEHDERLATKYIKSVSFNKSVVQAIKKLDKQCFVELTGHISQKKSNEVLTTSFICDTFKLVHMTNIEFVSKGGVNIEILKKSLNPLLSKQLPTDDELILLEEQLKSLK